MSHTIQAKVPNIPEADYLQFLGFGLILGKMLEVSGGAERIANSLLHWLGRDRATWVMMLIGFIAGIPVFVEVGFVLLVPLVIPGSEAPDERGCLYYQSEIHIRA